jgi:hypothetical protein
MLSRPPGTPAAEGDGDFQLRVLTQREAPRAKPKPKTVATPVKKKR